jgi:uncharacterized protein YndB with AHSA1/START domain
MTGYAGAAADGSTARLPLPEAEATTYGFGMRVTASIEIARSPPAVWELVVDPGRDPIWCPKVKSVRPVGHRRWRVSHAPVPGRRPMTLMVEQLTVEPPTRLLLREEDEASVFEVEYRLTPAGTGTSFTQTSDMRWKRLPRALHPLFTLGVRRDVQRQLRCLRDYLEATGEAS